ncbi:MAG: hypothetical protein ACLP0J_07025 [Solirubrobacteraceae bacterium]
MPDRSATDDLDAAIAAISDPERLRQAQDLVARVAPGLQRVLASAIADGGWFDTAHGAALREAVALEDPQQRLEALDSLIAEETRLAMLVGAAVGFELARELDRGRESETNKED